MKNTSQPWDFLDQYRGTLFSGTWPTLPELFRISASRFPERPCFTIYDPGRVSLTYRQALEIIEQTAVRLATLGLGRGSKAAVCGANSPEWAIAYLAVLFTGAVVVPIDYQLKNAEVDNLLRASGAEILFVGEDKFMHFSTPRAENAQVSLKAVIGLDKHLSPYLYEFAGPASAPGNQTASGQQPTPARQTTPVGPASADDLAAILFTSGTTGRPKGVMLSHANLSSDCFLAQANLKIHPTDVFYALLPIHHSYCMLAVFIESFSVGAETVFGKKLVIKQVLHDLKAAGVTMFLGVPLLFNKILAGIMRGVREKGPAVYLLIRALMRVSGLIKKLSGVNPGKRIFHSVLDKASLASIRICISGGGPLAPAVFRRYNELGIDFVQGYGLTETSPILTLNPTEAYKETSVGRVLPEIDMKIIDPDERGAGEIVVRGPMVMQGYYEMPEETREVFTPDGYLRTGDVGYLDSDGYLYLTGRAKNLIVTEGGKNVYPEELENRFQLYDEISQILVRGYMEKPGSAVEEIEALVHPNLECFKSASGSPAPEARINDIVAAVNRDLLPYQRIKRVIMVDEAMEMTTTKKIKRHVVG